MCYLITESHQDQKIDNWLWTRPYRNIYCINVINVWHVFTFNITIYPHILSKKNGQNQSQLRKDI